MERRAFFSLPRSFFVIPDGCPAKAGRKSGTHSPAAHPVLTDVEAAPACTGRMGPGPLARLRGPSDRDDNG